DPAGVIRTVNDQALHLLGYAREELIGQSVDRFVPTARAAGREAHRPSLTAPPTARPIRVERELPARRQNGTEIPVEITLGPVQTDERLLVIAAVRDIPDRRAA